MSQKNFQIFRSQISDLKTDNVDYLKKPPWKKIFFYIFAIHLTSRYEKRCRMLQRLFSLFQGSKNQLCEKNFWNFCKFSAFSLEFQKLFSITRTFFFYFGQFFDQKIQQGGKGLKITVLSIVLWEVFINLLKKWLEMAAISHRELN